MSALDDLKPKRNFRVIDLVAKAGVDVSDWANTKGRASTNPKYCYNWSFERPGELVVLCLWHKDLHVHGSTVILKIKRRNSNSSHRSPIWLRRRQDFDRCLESAYLQQLPLRVIVIDGAQRGTSYKHDPSLVKARLLDPVPWAITKYDYETGERLLVRGATPIKPRVGTVPDVELSWFEGPERPKFVLHRQRERRARAAKIAEALAKNGGRLVCEVKNCGFDFQRRYGGLGKGYAQVHHLKPLRDSPTTGRKVNLKDLAIVCANCHAMIHVGGKCRALASLVRQQQRLDHEERGNDVEAQNPSPGGGDRRR